MAVRDRLSRSSWATLVCVVLAALPAWAGCPTPQKVSEATQKAFQRDVEVVSVRPSRAPGLCEVQIRLLGQDRIIYTDGKGDFVVAGQLFEAQSGLNLTKEAMVEINRFSPEEMKSLESLTAFTVGEKGKVVYFVTDPQCPYCTKAEAVLKTLAGAGEIQVRFLLFPLQFHKGAKEQCISIICDKKGIEGLDSGYQSENQCPDGAKKVEDTIGLLQKKGVSGTPTYIFPTGRYHSGVLLENVLRERMEIARTVEPEGKK